MIGLFLNYIGQFSPIFLWLNSHWWLILIPVYLLLFIKTKSILCAVVIAEICISAYLSSIEMQLTSFFYLAIQCLLYGLLIASLVKTPLISIAYMILAITMIFKFYLDASLYIADTAYAQSETLADYNLYEIAYNRVDLAFYAHQLIVVPIVNALTIIGLLKASGGGIGNNDIINGIDDNFSGMRGSHYSGFKTFIQRRNKRIL